MLMQPASSPLRSWLAEAPAGASLLAPDRAVTLRAARSGAALGGAVASLAGQAVLVDTRTQIAAALALVALDGVARRIVVAPPDLSAAHRATVIADAAVEAVVTDDPPAFAGAARPIVPVRPAADGSGRETGGRARGGDAVAGEALPPPRGPADVDHASDTEWILLTSGTTGTPKMVAHSRAGLMGAIAVQRQAAALVPVAGPRVWGTFYDIRRYGGLQILLRALSGTATLVLSQVGEPVPEHLARLAAAGVTHLTGTPSHWRRVLMHPEAALIAPGYVRLSGEIADQAILDRLKAAYPRAAIGHAYASTEAGVGFEVDDGREGFPAHYLDPGRPVAMKVEDGSLRIRSPRTASGYVGRGGAALAEADGFVDTDDLVERRGDRFFFTGRRSGVINVGGLKVHPEEVEAVINRHPAVRLSLVHARPNPITGAVVVADVVAEQAAADPSRAGLKAEILSRCRASLAGHKVPVVLRFVEALAVTPAGKLVRPHA